MKLGSTLDILLGVEVEAIDGSDQGYCDGAQLGSAVEMKLGSTLDILLGLEVGAIDGSDQGYCNGA